MILLISVNVAVEMRATPPPVAPPSPPPVQAPTSRPRPSSTPRPFMKKVTIETWLNGNVTYELRALRVLIFTMDSLTTTVEAAKRGQFSGEITFRLGLEESLKWLGHTVVVARSDEELVKFTNCTEQLFDVYIFDEWTLYSRRGLPRHFLEGREKQLFVLTYFGHAYPLKYYEDIPGINFLSPFGGLSSVNTFLGLTTFPAPLHPPHTVQWSREHLSQEEEEPIVLSEEETSELNEYIAVNLTGSEPFGIVWGKSWSYVQNEQNTLIKALNASNSLVLKTTFHPDTSQLALGSFSNRLQPLGHLKKHLWRGTLSEAVFMLGMRDPVLGPSAIEAVEQGCRLILPEYPQDRYIAAGIKVKTQHDWVVENTPPGYVCLYEYGSRKGLEECVLQALREPRLPPYRFPDFTWRSMRKRVYDVFLPYAAVKTNG